MNLKMNKSLKAVSKIWFLRVFWSIRQHCTIRTNLIFREAFWCNLVDCAIFPNVHLCQIYFMNQSLDNVHLDSSSGFEWIFFWPYAQVPDLLFTLTILSYAMSISDLYCLYFRSEVNQYFNKYFNFQKSQDCKNVNGFAF